MAITAATFQGYERVGTASYRVKVLITDAAKPGGSYTTWLTVTGSTLQALTDDAARQIAALAASDAQQDLLAGIAVGATIPIVAPEVVPVVPSADDTWLQNVRLLVRVKEAQAAGLSHATLTTDVTGLIATVNAGYTTARGIRL